MDIDAAKRAGNCFLCNKPGHLARDCKNHDPDRRRFAIRQMADILTEAERKELGF